MDGVNSSEDLAEYLKNKLNLPERFCQAFIDNYIDGSEFLLLTREDISQFIEPVGIVKKIIRHIEELKCVEQPLNDDTSAAPLPTATSPLTATTKSPLIFSSEVESSSVIRNITIPTVWSAETQRCLNEKRATPDVRKEIVRTMSVMMIAAGPEATTNLQCERTANAIVAQYPFLADPYGKSQSGSWKCKLIECIRNKEKYQNSKAGAGSTSIPKSRCKEPLRKKRIGIKTVISVSDENVDEEALREAIAKEMSNKKIRIEVLRPLMNATFNSRRLKIGETPIQEMLKLYEPLRLPEILEYEFALLISKSDIKGIFTREWKKWQEVIVSYCDTSSAKNKIFASIDDTENKEILALKRLVAFFMTKGNNFNESLVLLYSEYEVAVPMEEIATMYPKKNMPRIVNLGNQQCFIIAEQDVLTEVNNLTDAIFLWFIAHYVFDIKYEKTLTNVCHFFQDNIFQLNDQTSRSAKYNSIVGDLMLVIDA